MRVRTIMAFASLAVALPHALDPPEIEYGPDTTVITEPRYDDGRINYLAALNQRMSEGVTPENNVGVDILRLLSEAYLGDSSKWQIDALKELGVERDAEHPVFISFDEFCDQEEIGSVTERELDNTESRPWSEDKYPIVAQWLDANKATLDVATEASCKDRFYVPLVIQGDDKRPMLFDAMLSHLPFLQEIARTLLIRANRSIASGETDAAWLDILTVKRLGRLVTDEPILISHLVGRAMDRDAAEAIANLLSESELSAERASEMSAELASLPSFTPMLEALDLGDRFMMLDAAQRDPVSWLPSALPEQTFLDERKIELLARHYDPNVLLRAINKEQNDAQLAFNMVHIQMRLSTLMISTSGGLECTTHSWAFLTGLTIERSPLALNTLSLTDSCHF